MRKAKIIKKIEKVAEANGWSVFHSGRFDEPGNLDFEFSQSTSMGQDFCVSCILSGNDPDTLLKDIRSGYDSFDPDEEAFLWIGPDGHGKNGAPYHIKDIVKDMEEADEMYKTLVEALENEFRS